MRMKSKVKITLTSSKYGWNNNQLYRTSLINIIYVEVSKNISNIGIFIARYYERKEN